MVLCTGLLVGCDKGNNEYEPEEPPVEQPEVPEEPEQPEEPDKPTTPPSINDIIKTKIGDINMIVGTYDWNDIAYGNGRYVAVGGGNNTGGYITSSTDGTNWSIPQKVSGISNRLSFVVMNAIGNFSTSVDGITWTKFKYSGVYIVFVHNIIYSNGKLIAIGKSYVDNEYFVYTATSIDGENWTNLEPIKDESGIILQESKSINAVCVIP